MLNLTRLILAAFAALLSVAAAAPAMAQTRPNIVVMGEDADEDSVPRGNRIFQRVVTELGETMNVRGYNVYDETAVAMNVTQPGRVRRRDAELIDVARSIQNPPVARAHERSGSGLLLGQHLRGQQGRDPMIRAHIAGAVLAFAMAAGAASASDAVDRTTRAATLDAARVPVTEALHKRVLFKVERLHAEGDWAFVAAEMREPDGRPVSYAGTPLAEEARRGFLSGSFAALLRLDGARWMVVAKAIGPTDVPWSVWSTDYGVPARLFEK